MRIGLPAEAAVANAIRLLGRLLDDVGVAGRRRAKSVVAGMAAIRRLDDAALVVDDAGTGGRQGAEPRTGRAGRRERW
jgi:hypothetical protein